MLLLHYYLKALMQKENFFKFFTQNSNFSNDDYDLGLNYFDQATLIASRNHKGNLVVMAT